jgi:hypothetical protein
VKNPYSVLGVSADAPDAVVDAAYRALAKEKHPDNGGDPDEFKEIKQAYDRIKSDENVSQSSDNSNSSPGWFGDIFDEILGDFEPVETITAVGDPDEGITVEGDFFTVTLLGILPHTNVYRLVRLPGEMDGEHRNLVLFKIQNTTDDVHRWSSDYTQYMDTEGFTYDEETSVFINEDKLQPRWKTVGAELDANSQTYFLSMVEKMPSDAQISKITHRQKIFDQGRISGYVKDEERYEFDITEESRNLIELE